MREPDLTLHPKRIIVYAWLDENGKTLYVGMSRAGLVRPLARDHVAYAQGYRLSVWHCKTKEGALRLESQLIRQLNPPLNVAHPNSEPWILPKPFMVEKVPQVNTLEPEARLETDGRLEGHKPGCGCLPEDWEEGKTIRAIP